VFKALFFCLVNMVDFRFFNVHDAFAFYTVSFFVSSTRSIGYWPLNAMETIRLRQWIGILSSVSWKYLFQVQQKSHIYHSFLVNKSLSILTKSTETEWSCWEECPDYSRLDFLSYTVAKLRMYIQNCHILNIFFWKPFSYISKTDMDQFC